MEKNFEHNQLVEDDLKITMEKPIDDPRVRNEVTAEVKKKFRRSHVAFIIILVTLAILMYLLFTIIPMK